jgi:hypothetical protein
VQRDGEDQGENDDDGRGGDAGGAEEMGEKFWLWKLDISVFTMIGWLRFVTCQLLQPRF